MSGFNKRTMKSVLRQKAERLIASIKNPEVQEAMKKDLLITGGAITSMAIGEKINDYDFYFRTIDTAHKVAEYYVQLFNEIKAEKDKDKDASSKSDKVLYLPTVKRDAIKNIRGQLEERVLIYMKSAGVAGEDQEPYDYFEMRPEHETDEFINSLSDESAPILDQAEEMAEILKKTPLHDYRPVFLTDNAITLSNKAQLIIRFSGSPEEIHRNFDYVHCTGVYDYNSNELHMSPEMMEACLSKRLIYVGSLYPMASVLRMRKFLKRGWNISAGQVIKMMHQCADIDWNNPEMLKEQLMGVDVAYMHQLIQYLNQREPGERIDTNYLASLLDKIFDE